MTTLLTTYQQTEDHIMEGIKELIDEHEYDTEYLTSNHTLEEMVEHFIEEFESSYISVDYISGVEDINFNAREMIKLMKNFNELRLEYGSDTFMDWDRLDTEGTEYFINNVIWTAYWNNKDIIVDYLTEKIRELRTEVAAVAAEVEAAALDAIARAGGADALGDYIVDSITRAYHRGGTPAVVEKIRFWMNQRSEHPQERLNFVITHTKRACNQLGININFKHLTKTELEEQQKELEFVKKFKKTTIGVIEVMLEKIDEKKQDMKENDYLEIMKHLKDMWELVKEVKSKEQAIKQKEVVNDFWKGLSRSKFI
jgi:hypothetical protein